jgi:hypothetical protein
MPPLPAPATPDESARHLACVSAIVTYLAANPMAADSIDGIARWWLGPARGGGPARGDVEHAVATLVARGFLREVRLTDGSVIYQSADGAPSH